MDAAEPVMDDAFWRPPGMGACATSGIKGTAVINERCSDTPTQGQTSFLVSPRITENR